MSEFAQKSTKVVLSGNEMNDAMFREGVKKAWNISPYEFCDMETFEKEKRDSTKFFLLISETTKNNEEGAGIMCIGLFQGSSKPNLFKVTSIPFCPANEPDGREYTFLPLLLRTLQNDVEAIMKNQFNPGSMVKMRVKEKRWDGAVCFNKDDLAVKLGASSIAAFKEFDIHVLSAEDVDNSVRKAVPGAIVSYIVAPSEETQNGYCYKMLIDAGSGELYFIGKHTLSEKKGRGFLRSDMDSIFSHKK